MQSSVLGFVQQVKLQRNKNIKNEKNNLPLKITIELIIFFSRLMVDW